MSRFYQKSQLSEIHNVMEFKIWLENEAGLNAGFPEIQSSPNRGNPASASDEVIRTGLQPQVDAQNIKSKGRSEQDKILAIDSEIEHLDSNLPDSDEANTPKLNKFKELWKKLRDKWEEIKNEEDPSDEGEEGLADMQDAEYADKMQKHPNMVPSQDRSLGGVGIMGTF